MLSKIKLILWKLNLYPDKCPYCGKVLDKHGFRGYNQRWTCPTKDCLFNGRWKEPKTYTRPHQIKI